MAGMILITSGEADADVARNLKSSLPCALFNDSKQQHCLLNKSCQKCVLFSCSGITDEELCAAGVSNPSHRRRILENLPKIWD